MTEQEQAAPHPGAVFTTTPPTSDVLMTRKQTMEFFNIGSLSALRGRIERGLVPRPLHMPAATEHDMWDTNECVALRDEQMRKAKYVRDNSSPPSH